MDVLFFKFNLLSEKLDTTYIKIYFETEDYKKKGKH